MEGGTVRIDGIAGSRADALLRIIRVDGSVISQVLTAESADYTIGSVHSSADVLFDYIELGVKHFHAVAAGSVPLVMRKRWSSSVKCCERISFIPYRTVNMSSAFQ